MVGKLILPFVLASLLKWRAESVLFFAKTEIDRIVFATL